MYKFTAAAASDVEDILDQSLSDFGTRQTEAYYTSLTQ